MSRREEGWIGTDEAERRLRETAADRLEDERVVRRACLLLACLEARPLDEIAREFHVSRSLIFRWRSRYREAGVAGLRDRPRPGKPPRYDTAFEQRVLNMLRQAPPPGVERWNGTALAQALNASDDAVWRVLRRQGIVLSRQRIWQIPAGRELETAWPGLLGLYGAPPVWMAVLGDAVRKAGAARVITRNRRAGSALEQTAEKENLQLEEALAILASIPGENMAESRRQADVLNFLEDAAACCRPGTLRVLTLGSAATLGISSWMAAHTEVEFCFFASFGEIIAALDGQLPIGLTAGEHAPLVRRVMAYPAHAPSLLWKNSGM